MTSDTYFGRLLLCSAVQEWPKSIFGCRPWSGWHLALVSHPAL